MQTRIPPKKFASDGCSGGLSKAWKFVTGHVPPFEMCCFAHDVEYHFGSGAGATAHENYTDRLYADNQLFKCIWRDGIVGKVWSPIIWIGVRIGGGAYWPTTYKWGFGWDK